MLWAAPNQSFQLFVCFAHLWHCASCSGAVPSPCNWMTAGSSMRATWAFQAWLRSGWRAFHAWIVKAEFSAVFVGFDVRQPVQSQDNQSVRPAAFCHYHSHGAGSKLFKSWQLALCANSKIFLHQPRPHNRRSILRASRASQKPREKRLSEGQVSCFFGSGPRTQRPSPAGCIQRFEPSGLHRQNEERA